MLAYVGAGLYLLDMTYSEYRSLKSAVGPELTWDFKAYVQYTFDCWFSSGRAAEAILLAGLALLLLFIGAGLSCVTTNAGSFANAIFNVYRMMVSNDLATKQPYPWGKVLGLLILVGSIVILGLGFAMIQHKFAQIMDHLRSGFKPVVEAGHVLLLGNTENMPLLIQ